MFIWSYYRMSVLAAIYYFQILKLFLLMSCFVRSFQPKELVWKKILRCSWRSYHVLGYGDVCRVRIIVFCLLVFDCEKLSPFLIFLIFLFSIMYCLSFCDWLYILSMFEVIGVDEAFIYVCVVENLVCVNGFKWDCAYV